MDYTLETQTVIFAVSEAPDDYQEHEMPLAMGYVPMQKWGCVYEDQLGWSRGTIFPCLDKPFLEGACPCV